MDVRSLVVVALSALFAYILFPAFGWAPLGGIALGFSVSNWLETAVLLWLLRRRIGGLNGSDLLAGAWQMGIATVVMGLAVAGMLWLIRPWSPLLVLPITGAIGAVVYFAICWALKLREVTALVNIILRRLGRSTG